MGFATRIGEVPRLGVGMSCEFNAGGRPALDPLGLREEAPGLVHFLEIGADLERGLDDSMRRWAAAGLPTTYHFLDVNLAEEEDVDESWVQGTVALAREVGATWLCGDAGWWHLGRRERGHGLLLPPILRLDAAREMARAIRRLSKLSGMMVVPENPTAAAFVGRLHLLDFFARVVDGSDSGFLLDVAHLAIFQRMRGHRPTDGLDGFPLERIVEIHVAGGTARTHRGLPWIEDDHSPEPLPDAWEILEAVLPRAKNLKAIVYECEHNTVAEVLPGFERLDAMFPMFPKTAGQSTSNRPVARQTESAEPEGRDRPDRPSREAGIRKPVLPSAGAIGGPGHEALARVAIRMHFDPSFVEAVHRDPESALSGLPITPGEREDLLAVDPRAFGVDPLRRARALRDLVAEYRTSSTLILAATRRIASLEGFFSGPNFHDEVQRRGSLAMAFAAFLRTFTAHPQAPAQLADTILLEETMARLRREIEAPPAPPAGGRYRRAPATAGLRVDGSTLELVQGVERWLFEAGLIPGLSLCDDAPGLPPPPAPRPDAPLHLLLSPDSGQIVLAEPGRAAVEALISLETPLDEGAFDARARSRGLGSDLARRLLADLEDAGLVIRGDVESDRCEDRGEADRPQA